MTGVERFRSFIDKMLKTGPSLEGGIVRLEPQEYLNICFGIEVFNWFKNGIKKPQAQESQNPKEGPGLKNNCQLGFPTLYIIGYGGICWG